jgi:hypothetical protein
MDPVTLSGQDGHMQAIFHQQVTEIAVFIGQHI